VIVAINKELAEQMDMGPEDAASQIGGDDVTTGIQDVESQPYDDGTNVGTISRFSNQPLEDVASSINGTLVRDGDLFVFQGDPVSDSDTAGMEDFLEGADISLSITFPGAITDTNGSVSGTTVTWNLLSLKEAPYATGNAIGTGDSGDGMPAWLWVVIVGGAVVIVAVIVMLSRKSKDEVAETAPVAKKTTAKKAPAKKAPAKKPTDKK
jgi:hypothetical protein